MVVVRVFKGGALVIKGVHYVWVSTVKDHARQHILTRTTFRATAVLLLPKHKPV